jgi:ribosomal protein S19
MTIKPKPVGSTRTHTRVDRVWVRVTPDILGVSLGLLKPTPETRNYTRLNIKLLNYLYVNIILI